MQATRWIIVTLACSVLAAMATWFAAKQTEEPPQPDAMDKPMQLTAAELLQQARHVLGAPPSVEEGGIADQRVDQLRRMAAIRQSEHPQEIPAAWDQFGQLLTDLRGLGKSEGVENDSELVQLNTELMLLLRYDEDLDDAALASRTAEDFELVWHIKGRVADAIHKRRAELVQQIQDRLAKSTESLKEQNTVTGLKEFAELKKKLDGSVVTLVATLDSANKDDGLKQILSIVAPHEERAHQTITTLQEKTAEFERQLREPHNRIEPKDALADGAIKSPSILGPSEELLHQLHELEEAFAATGLASWRTIHDRLGRQTVGQTGELAKIGAPLDSPLAIKSLTEDKLISEMNTLADKLYSLQQLAYNLWALREIQAAEENTDNWDVQLARIDTGLLHPTVAALYQITYGDRIREVEDPLARGAKAQHVLSNPKIGLSSF